MSAPSEGAEWERLFWLVFERTSNPIVLLDDRRRIVDVNDAAVSLFGVSDKRELIGSSIADSIVPAERPQAERDWEAFLQSGDYTGKRMLLRADGTQVNVEFAARLAVIGGRRLAIYVVAPHDSETASPGALAVPRPLTMREREVVTLIALGYETAEIAAELHISPETVRTHVRNAMSRLGAHTRAQLVAIALCSDQAVHSARVPS